MAWTACTRPPTIRPASPPCSRAPWANPQLWQTLVDGITPPPSIDAVASRHLALFSQLELARAA